MEYEFLHTPVTLQGQCLSYRILTQTEAVVMYQPPQLIKNCWVSILTCRVYI